MLSHTRSIPGPPLQDSGNTAQLMKSFEPVRFTFAGETFYLQTIVSSDKRFLYHFVQMEGSKADCLRFSVKISVMGCTSFTSAQVFFSQFFFLFLFHCFFSPPGQHHHLAHHTGPALQGGSGGHRERRHHPRKVSQILAST